jgi:hypothetical protein
MVLEPLVLVVDQEMVVQEMLFLELQVVLEEVFF